MSQKLRVISLFSGCGGLDLGFEGGFSVPAKSVRTQNWIESIDEKWAKLKRTNYEIVFANDIRPSAKRLWERNFKRPEVFYLGSIVDYVKRAKSRDFTFPDAEIVIGGFPCQDFSVAGKRRGFASEKNHLGIKSNIGIPTYETRGNLYMWMRDVVDIVKPFMFVAENVKGLVSLSNVKGIIENDFRNIDGGYAVVEARVLHAANYGVPQNRERVFFLGFRKDALKKEVFMEYEKSGVLGNFSIYPPPSHKFVSNQSLQKGDFIKVRDVLEDLPEPEESSDPSHRSYSKAKWYGKHCQGQVEIRPDGLGPTIRAEHHGNIEFRRLSPDHGGKILEEFHLSERRLSVRECARIQTFPDTFEFVGEGVGASEAYKLVGNAVPPLLGFHMAKNLEDLWWKIFRKEDNSSNIKPKKDVVGREFTPQISPYHLPKQPIRIENLAQGGK